MKQLATLRMLIFHAEKSIEDTDNDNISDATCYLDAAQTLTQTLTGTHGEWLGKEISEALDEAQSLVDALPASTEAMDKHLHNAVDVMEALIPLALLATAKDMGLTLKLDGDDEMRVELKHEPTPAQMMFIEMNGDELFEALQQQQAH